VLRLIIAFLVEAMTQDDTDSESGSPEIVSLSSSASAARGHRRALRNFHAAEKQKAREKNKWRDERLKAQADRRRRVTATKRGGMHDVGDHEVEPDTDNNVSGRDDLHQLGNPEEETEEDTSGSDSGAEWGGINIEIEESFRVMAEEPEDVEMLKGEESANVTRSVGLDRGEGKGGNDNSNALQLPSSKYLPDHVFLSALSKPKARNDVRPSRATPQTRPPGKRQDVHARAKDVVVGWVPISHLNTGFLFFLFYESDPLLSTRTVRTLSSSPATAHLPLPRTTLPPPRVKKFLENALALHGTSKRVSKLSPRWERRPRTLNISCGYPSLNSTFPPHHSPPWCVEAHDRRTYDQVCTCGPTLN
jgi:hypothetical protein